MIKTFNLLQHNGSENGGFPLGLVLTDAALNHDFNDENSGIDSLIQSVGEQKTLGFHADKQAGKTLDDDVSHGADLDKLVQSISTFKQKPDAQVSLEKNTKHGPGAGLAEDDPDKPYKS